MRVHVDEPGYDCLAGSVDHAIGTGGAARAYAGDTTSLDDDCAAVDHPAMIERENAGVGERHAAHRDRARHGHLERRSIGAAGVHVMHVEPIAAPVLERPAVAPAREEPAVAGELGDRERATTLLDAQCLSAGAVPRQRRDVDIVALLKGDPLSTGRRHDLVRRRERHVNLLVAAVGLHGHERRSSAASPSGRCAAHGRRSFFREEDPTVGPERWTDELSPRLAAQP